MFCPCVYLCAPCMPGDQRGQKMASDPLELELEIIMSCHVGGLGVESNSFERAASWIYSPLSQLPSPSSIFLR